MRECMWIVDFILRTQYKLIEPLLHSLREQFQHLVPTSLPHTVVYAKRWKMKQKTHQIQGKIDCHSFNGSSAATKSSIQLPSALLCTQNTQSETDLLAAYYSCVFCLWMLFAVLALLLWPLYPVCYLFAAIYTLLVFFFISRFYCRRIFHFSCVCRLRLCDDFISFFSSPNRRDDRCIFCRRMLRTWVQNKIYNEPRRREAIHRYMIHVANCNARA